jgi:uncharacterized cupredoxin-like copper-binding protein
MRRYGVVALLVLIVAGSLAGVAFSGSSGSDTQQTIAFRFSRFQPGDLTVPAGVPITFTLRNDDPITHEWIVGTDEVHERHRSGTEPYHDKIPSEVTVPALSSRETTLTFTEPGTYTFVCHLPGHEAYGMTGTLQVLASR